MLIQLHKLLDVAQCYDLLRTIRWPTGVTCPTCSATDIVKNGKDPHQIHCQHYKCKACQGYFDDVTDTVFSASHQGIHQWITVLYLMNLNVSMAQIADELSVSVMTAQGMCATIREGVVKKDLFLSLASRLKLMNSDRRCGYVIAGHKGQANKVRKAGRKPRRRRLKGKQGRGTSADEKNPVFGLVERGGLVCLRVLPNVKQNTIKPVLNSCVTQGAIFYTDEYNIYNKVESWGYVHKVVNHGQGEYARDEDGDGFCDSLQYAGSYLVFITQLASSSSGR
jgi:transposase-like protein